MTDLEFDILRSAVRIAKDQQIRSLRTLKDRLGAMYPNNPEEIKEAIATWAQHIRRNHGCN